MASDADLCNMSLSLIGDDTVVLSIDPPDGSAASGHCARFLPIARAEMLELLPWRITKRRVQLAEVPNPSDVWAYAYAVPSSMLKANKVLSLAQLPLPVPFWTPFLSASELAIFDERGSADFDIEGETLLTNEPEATLLYTVDVPDLTKWTPSARTALSYLLASFLAGPIIKGGEGAKTAGRLRELATNMARSAAARDANNGAESSQTPTTFERARL